MQNSIIKKDQRKGSRESPNSSIHETDLQRIMNRKLNGGKTIVPDDSLSLGTTNRTG
jgi:hypothetical protein